MRNRILTLGILFLFVCSAFIPMSLGINTRITNTREQPSTFSRGKTLYVGGSGGDNYTRIQYAIDNASDGDTVFVFDDSSPYYENVVINKSINLIGEDRNTTIIDGDYKNNVVEIVVDNVTISGFTIKNVKKHDTSNYKYNVIKVENFNSIIISDNKISIGLQELYRHTAGVYLKESSYNLICNNVFFENVMDWSYDFDAIVISNGHNNNISRNEIPDYSDGIELIGGGCYDNIVIDNHIYAGATGIIIYGTDNKILGNKINNCEWFGIIIHGQNHIISGNILTDNDWSIAVGYSRKNIISRNHIANNEVGIWLEGADENIIKTNNFINNELQIAMVFFSTFPSFPKPNQFKWNYWSDSFGRFPKFIIGYCWLVIIYIPVLIPWISVDRYPAKEPYDFSDDIISSSREKK